MIILPTSKVPATSTDPRFMILYGRPKTGMLGNIYRILCNQISEYTRQLCMKDMKEALSLAEQEYANSFMSIRDISKKYGVQRQTLTGWLLAKGYTVENRRAYKSFDVHYFDSIDTEEKAYWLGFLFADGALTTNGKSYDIEFTLKLEDKEHVEKFASCIRKNKITTDSYRARCIIGSKKMFNTLSSYGCTTKKSLTLRFPNTSIFSDEKLIRHFIRGYVDGDGCISYENKEKTTANVSILGTEEFLNKIQEIYGSSKNLHNNARNQNITKVLQFTCRQAFEFAKWLYEDSTIYLKRKHDRYLHYCRLYEKSNRSLLGKYGELCDENTVVNTEITKGSVSPYSVETE